MPLTYGGGIKSVKEASKIISMGFEKVSISSAFFETPTLINDISSEVGAQSLVVCIDVKKINNEYSIFTMTLEHYEEFLKERRKLMAEKMRDYYFSL